MRVIAGSARRIELKTVAGQETRPTTDRIKETLFNMLQPYLADCHFLDLFAGSGGIGIEALSRGAAHAVFVESNPSAVTCIKENLEKTRLADRAEVMSDSVMTGLRKLESRHQVYDIIYMDPPYEKGLEREALAWLKGSGMMDDQTWIIVEADLKEDFSYLKDLGFTLDKEKRYKTNKHMFIGRLK
ncbi:16S rRNA (guanine(966)-N(2))-methyltransferase RsmD [Anaerolentibacter hominis]|uniref:16S rRNA (guanine(966)-N(2))-methyltransferase RsmD n=1 Tax=Anaerolentibacter hominis TaxID=3079009 RepID=UPI0031B8616B